MQRQRQRDTRPELALRRAIWGLGLRYRVHISPLKGRGKADVVFRRERVAVYVDGCYWHGCPSHGTIPKNNREWWSNKIETNRQRDAETQRHLAESGWLAIRIWEHEDPMKAAQQVARYVLARRALLASAKY